MLGLGLLCAGSVHGDTESFDCLVEPMVVAQVGSPVQGVIQRLLVDRSAMVAAGEPIAQLESGIEQASLDQARMRARMQSEIEAREADLVLATHNMTRMDNLFTQKMVPAQQRDEAHARLQVAEAAVKQARENYRLLQQELKRAEELLAQRTIRSPVDGVVVEHRAFPGEFIYENPVMTIAQLDPLRVEVVLPARYFGQFSTDDVAVIYPEIGSDRPLIAEVDVVDRLLDNRSGTFGIRLKLPNPGLAIPGGQKCRLEFASTTSTQPEVVASADP
jgi:RND family efflux transporter MFP subunit